jgi:sphinganine-1-phosphate aldolase
VVLVDVDASFRAQPAAMAAAIGPRTIMIVGSAPSYAHAVVDPIAALAELARSRGVWLHVDACVGGWLLPFWRRLGAHVPDFDFALDGVSSVSVDLHKYAFVPKGASLVLFRDRSLRREAIFACNEWTGYSVINPTVQSSRSGGPLAAAWAVLHRLGDEGYLDLARRTLEGTRRLVDGVRAIPGLEVVVEPDFCLLSVTSREVGVFHVIDEMNARGWYLQPQLAYRGSPASIHLSLSPQNAGHVERMLEDLRAAVEAARALPFGQLAAMIQGAIQSGALGDLRSPDAVGKLMALGGLSGTALPTRMAGVHEMLGALPRELAREVLIEFVNDLYVPTRGPTVPAPVAVGAGA